MRGMFRRKLKDFAEQQHDQQEEVSLFDRLKKEKYEHESEEELQAKNEFRRMVVTKPPPPPKKTEFKDEPKETNYPTSGMDAMKIGFGTPKPKKLGGLDGGALSKPTADIEDPAKPKSLNTLVSGGIGKPGLKEDPNQHNLVSQVSSGRAKPNVMEEWEKIADSHSNIPDKE